MKKEEFNKLSIEEQLIYVNKELLDNASLRSIAEKIGISKTTIRERFEKIGHVFNTDQRQYIKREEDEFYIKLDEATKNINMPKNKHKNNTNSTVYNHKDNLTVTNLKLNTNIKETVNSSNTDELITQNTPTNNIDSTNDKHNNFDFQTTLFSEDEILALKELIAAKDRLINSANKKKYVSKDIIIDSERLSGDLKTRSFTLYNDVLEVFTEFCKANKQYTQKDLMSMALVEYMDKYKK